MTHNILGLSIAFAILWMVCAIPARAENFYSPEVEQYFHDQQEHLRYSNDQADRDSQQSQIQHDNDMRLDSMQREIDRLRNGDTQ